MFHLLGICTESQLDDLSFITPGKGRNHNGKRLYCVITRFNDFWIEYNKNKKW